jgi:hypothetical protein
LNFCLFRINICLLIEILFFRPYQLKPLKFEGDKTGVLHVGPGQTVVIQHPDDLEFLVNVFVYNGGKLILPQSFECYDVDFNIW